MKVSKIIFFLFSLFTFTPAFSDINLVFGVYASNKPTEMVAKFRPILNELEKQMGLILNEPVDIQMKISPDYEEGQRQLLNNEVDFSRFGAISYVLVKDKQPEIEILAIESEHGNYYFKGVIAVPIDSELKSLGDLKGKSFAFGNEQSTIGRFLSQLLLTQQGIKAKDLSKFSYLGRHDKVAAVLNAKKFDAGALNEKTFNQSVENGKKIKALAYFPAPTKPWITRKGLPERIKIALSQSLLKFSNEAALENLNYEGFLPPNEEIYETIKDAIEFNPQFFLDDSK